MNVFETHMKQIIKANDDNRLAIFIGAGVSLSSNTDTLTLPTWSDLIKELQGELGLEDENDYLKVAQLYFLEFKEPTYYSKIKEFFPDHIEPSKTHKLIFELQPQCIITTNWDCLLEKTIENEGYLYDTICSDKDLVKSTNMKKVIKMHGDFKNHNIVFKEDDYLNYAHNFPLIENYIKSILSTHTILFLGYSYNDLNLKQIMTWIQNHSEYCPPMYLTVFNENKAQQQYLNNHGIKALVLDNLETGKQNINNYTERVTNFLSKIKNSTEKIELVYTDSEVVSYIYEQLCHLERLNYILLDFILVSLTNCGLHYDGDEQPILELYRKKGVLTRNYDENKRIIYEQFISILVEYDQLNHEEREAFVKSTPLFLNILKILSKANIKGISLDDRNYLPNETLPGVDLRNKSNKVLLSFKKPETSTSTNINSLMSQSYTEFNTKNYEKSYNLTLQIITQSKKQKDYAQLLISIFNKNSLLWLLKYSFGHSSHEDIDDIDIQHEFFQFPKKQINNLQPLYDFISLNKIYQIAYSSSRKLLDTENSIDLIKNGGQCWNSQVTEFKIKHVDLLLFTTKNNIMMIDAAHSTAMQNFVKISIARQFDSNNVELDFYELFTCIKYFKNKELKSLFSIFTAKDSSKILNIPEKDYQWLIEEELHNILDQHISSHSFSDGKNIENVIYILALVELNKAQTALVMKEFSKLISSNKNTINTYESINSFLFFQHHLFKNKINPDILFELIENIIKKIIHHKANGWDIHAITGGRVNNLYGLVEVNDVCFKNEKLITILLAELQELPIKDKITYARSLLFSIFNIGNKKIKVAIETFITETISTTDYDDLNCNFSLWIIAVDFKEYNEEVITKLKGYLDKYREEKSFSSEFYEIKRLVDYLITEKQLNQFEESQKILNDLILKYESRDNKSFI